MKRCSGGVTRSRKRVHLVVSNLRRSDFKVSSFRSENDSRQRDEVEKKSQKWKGSCDDQEWCPHRVLVFSFQGTRRADLVCLKWAHCLRVLIFIDAPLFHAMHNIQRIARMSRVGKWTIDTAESLQHRVAEEGVEQVVSRWWKNYCQLKTGKFMGEDRFGNRYYEDMEANELGNAVNGRHRWVEYPVGKKDYDSSTVAPEWHAWLHYISDVPGKQMEQAHRRKYSIDGTGNLSGTKYAYSPNNFLLNPKYSKYQATDMKPEREHSEPAPIVAAPRRPKFSADDL